MSKITIELTEEEANYVAEAAYREIQDWDDKGHNEIKKPHVESAIIKLYKAAGEQVWDWPFVVGGNVLDLNGTKINVQKVSLLDW